MNDVIWVEACETGDIDTDEVLRFDKDERSFAIYNVEGEFFATDGHCTHEQQHLAEGFVFDGVIECPLHMGQFDIETGEAIAGPVCIDLKIYPVKVEEGRVYIGLSGQPRMP